MFGSILSAIGGFGGSLLGDFAGGAMNSYFSRDLMSKQNKYNTHAYKHRYQWQVEDMRNAGLNPLLSVGSAGSPASVGIANANASASASTAKQLDNVVQATQGLIKAQKEKTKAESRSANADAQAKEIQNMMMFDTGKSLASAKGVKSAAQDNIEIERSADGTPIVDVKVDGANPPPLWKVLANAKRQMTYLDYNDKDISIGLKEVKLKYNQQIQKYRDEFPILPALEVFGSSAKQVSGVVKDLKLTPKDLVDLYWNIKKLGIKPEKAFKRKEFRFLKDAF